MVGFFRTVLTGGLVSLVAGSTYRCAEENFLTNNPLPDGCPWGSLTTNGSNPYSDAPNTGVTRRYHFEIAKKHMNVDGFEKEMFLFNGEFPGPLIEANWGDWIEVTVHNKLNEGTSVHWHGFMQRETPWFDGAPGIQQCPIAPHSTFTYRFRADLYGTTWYHSHYSAQFTNGLFGPLVVYGPNHLDYDYDLGPLLLTDYYHKDYFDIISTIVGKSLNATIMAGQSDSNLINGRGSYNCKSPGKGCSLAGGIEDFHFIPGKKYRLRLINGGSEGQQKFSIDGHTMTVIAHDFVPVKPHKTTMVELGIGQRTDVIVEATGNRGDSYWIRSDIQDKCSLAAQPLARAAVYYPDADITVGDPNSTEHADIYPDCFDSQFLLNITEPIFAMTPAAVPEKTIDIAVNITVNATGFVLFTMNDSSFRANFNEPPLLLANKGNVSFPEEWNVINTGNAQTVRIALYNASPAPHPMHFHGHNIYQLAEGLGPWDGALDLRPNPPRRDTFYLRPLGHYVIQYESTNPGVWPLHCHIAWHVSAGLYVTLLEQTESIMHSTKIPQVVHQTCRDWWKYTGHNPVLQIDSGL